MRLPRRARPERVDKTRQKAAKRLSRLTVAEVLDWSDQAGSEVAKALNMYRKHGEGTDLRDAAEGISALQGCLDVLLERHHE